MLEVEDEFNSGEGGESSRVSEAATDIADAQLGEASAEDHSESPEIVGDYPNDFENDRLDNLPSDYGER